MSAIPMLDRKSSSIDFYSIGTRYCSGVSKFLIGILVLFSLWWLSVFLITLDPDNELFLDFGLEAALLAIPHLWSDGTIPEGMITSGYRLGMGLLLSILIGVPVGIVMGRVAWFKKLFNVPFQFFRMVSPLSWEHTDVVV